jgi:hypothetical protein
MESAMDDDEDDKSLLEKTIEAVKDMASSVTNAAKSAATPSEEEKMTAMDVPLVGDAAAMPMPLVAPKKRKAPAKRAPAKTPPKNATTKKAAKKTAKKSTKKSAAKKSNKAAKHSPAKKTKSAAGRQVVGKKKVAKKKKAKESRR